MPLITTIKCRSNNLFDDTSSIYSSIVSSTNAVQGTKVLETSSTGNSYIAIPVMAGEIYNYSFWSSSPEIGNGHYIEYGFSEPIAVRPAGAGNTEVNRYVGGGNIPWKEYTGTFTVPEGKTLWYIGISANGGKLHLDSVYVARVADVGTVMSIR